MPLYLTHKASGIRLSDANVDGWVRKKAQEYLDFHRDENFVVSVANSMTINYFRLLIKEGVIPHDEFFVIHRGLKYRILPSGKFPVYPPGLGDEHLLVLVKLARH